MTHRPWEIFAPSWAIQAGRPVNWKTKMRTGSWLTVPADSTTMFGKDHNSLWGNILRSLGEDMALYADMPADPQMN